MEIVIIVSLCILVGALSYLLSRARRGITLENLQEDYVLRKEYETQQSQLQLKVEEVAELRQKLGGKEFLTNQMKDLEEKFENLSNRIVSQGLKVLKEGSTEKMAQVINPFKDQLTEFRLSVEKSREASLKESEQLKFSLKQLADLNQNLSSEARNLTKALTMDSKKRGNWGEVILETVLEKSGLTKNLHYKREVMGISDQADLRADVIVNLPGERHLVIDSKVTLNAYLKYTSEEDEDGLYIQQHLKAVKTHINTLSKKRYDRLHNINSPDFVFMFMPLEPAFHDALRNDPELYLYAMERNVVLVTASTLLAALITIASSWQQDIQRQNVDLMAELAGKLYDQVSAFIKDMEGINQGLVNANRSYESAAKRLSKGNNNVIRLTGKMKELGAKVKDKGDNTLDSFETKYALG